MNNPEKLATQITQDENKQNKNTTQYVLDTTTRKQTQIIYAIFTTCFVFDPIHVIHCTPTYVFQTSK